MRSIVAVLLTLWFATGARAAQPHVTFVRTIPAPYDLGQTEVVAVIYALGDTANVSYFVDALVEQVNQSRTLHLERGVVQQIIGDRADAATIERLRRTHPADAYLGVRAFTCTSAQLGGERSVYDADRKRVKRQHAWIEAHCSARVDIHAGRELRRLFSFEVKGSGASSRVTELSDEHRESALLHAARMAAVDAASRITPRRVRESIVLDQTSPAFDEAVQLIEVDRLEEARAVWTAALAKHPRSAALHYNLALVSEALRDMAAAEKHYREAKTLRPGERRYVDEFNSFLTRRR